MTKMTLTPSALTLASATQSDRGPARRLIVLVPPLEVDLTVVTRRIWELAQASGAHIQFLGLYSDPIQEPRLRRDLVTMTAMTNDDRISSEAEVLFGKDWVAAIRSRWQPGDTVVSLEGQNLGLSQKPMSQVLQSDLNIPVHILTGIRAQDDERLSWQSQAKAWLGALGIVIVFFLLQVKIRDLGSGWVAVLQGLSVLVEVWLLWIWNSLSG